ncbi:MAG: nitrogenase cofactor biosynthesis protein NifB [Alphaproteobacteria bacterium]|nr:nitrogenase cofactor biosynthesis protein NifB [Alphaproteobacteria bacterium]
MSRPVVTLASIKRLSEPERPKIKASSSCASASDPRIADHPCYSEEAHHYFARMHVAVAPACNIQCNYCNRKFDCANESRPGVVSEKLTVEEGLQKVLAVAAKVPQMSVVGIAGPGDSLAGASAPKTFALFKAVRAALPDVKLCLSTNGLALAEHVPQLQELGIDHITVTLNAVDAEVGEKIYPWIFWQGRRLTGREAAQTLLERQLLGIEKAVQAGMLVKINSVLIPGINDDHLPLVHKAVQERGVFLHNIMPLISTPEHGTVFGLSGQRAPTNAQLESVQAACGIDAKLMRHCRQCRADAVGMLGEDRGQEFTSDKLPAQAQINHEARHLYRSVVAEERADRKAAALRADAALALAAHSPKRRVAVCTKGGGRINEHFGHAREFRLYDVDANGLNFVGVRRADNYCQGGWGEDDNMEAILKALEGCEAVLVSKIGRCPKDDLAKAGIDAVDGYALAYIEEGLSNWYAGLALPARISA